MNAVQCKLAHAREVKTYQETITKLQNEMKTLRMEMGRLNHDNISALHTISTNHQRMSPILKDIVANSSKALNGFRYHPETMVLAYDIQSHSASGYEILRNQIRFPLVQTLHTQFKEELSSIQNDLVDLAKISNICHQYRSSQNLNSQYFIQPNLSVDALCFKPYVIVDETGKVTWLKKVKEVDNQTLYN